MIRILAVSLFCLSVPACSFPDRAREHFKESRNFDVGRRIEVIPLQDPQKIVATEKGYSEYHYAFYNPKAKSECAWIYRVDDSKKVLSWEYTSDPKACFSSFGWGTPW
jgi:hypothetical protein